MSLRINKKHSKDYYEKSKALETKADAIQPWSQTIYQDKKSKKRIKATEEKEEMKKRSTI